MAASLWWDDPSSSSASKAEQQNKNEDLFVFGYACKLFRDDGKAKEIDEGKLLIPWMGDESLLIDRYDGRGHLYDLTLHNVDRVDKNPRLTEEEEAVEKACDEERYLELNTDVQEAAMYEEEEWKRYYLSLQEGYQAVGFSYEQPEGEAIEQAQLQDALEEEKEEIFVVPKELCMPPDMHAPICKKQNARIMKTANFIAQHGIQMEIMLKTKQAGNTQFDFLHFEDELNPYYKHVVSMIKSNKYKPPSEEEAEAPQQQDEGHDYLHPSLSAPSLPPPPPPPSKPIELPKVAIHDTPYGALIKSIKRNSEQAKPKVSQEAHATAHQVLPPPPIPVPLLPHVHSYPELSNHHALPPYSHPGNPPPPGTEPVSLPIVSSLNTKAFMDQLYSQPPPPGTESSGYPEEHGPQRKKERRRRRSRSSDSSSSLSSSDSESEKSRKHKRKSSKKSKVKPQRAEGPNPIAPPPPDIQPIIDRMAMYVAKNGEEFEMVVMGRKDPRFQFLNEYHAYYPYYRVMKESYLKDLQKSAAAAAAAAGDQDQEKLDKSDQASQRSVSFSIRGRGKEQEGATAGNTKTKSKTSLFQYDSSEGEDERHSTRTDPPSEPPSGVASPMARVSPDGEKEIAEKLKDKLASAMKERLSQSHKEKQLQAERKKKAAMFLNLLKAQDQSLPASEASTTQQPEESATLYVGEGSPGPEIFEYDNSTIPQRLEPSSKSVRKHSSKKEKKRRRRSPTPPSAYSLDKRSPPRASPSRWSSRPTPWSSRERSPPQWPSSRRNNRDVSIRSRSRSPLRKEEKKKKKHKRSKSRSPSRKSGKDKSRSHKSSSKDKDKKKEKKSRHRSRSKERGEQSSNKSSHTNGKSGASVRTKALDLEAIELPMDVSVASQSKSEVVLTEGSDFITDLSTIPIPTPFLSKTGLNSESTEDVQTTTSSASHTTSVGNSPSVTRSSTPSRSTGEATASSSDLMSKVRAMLKKSREMALKEDSLQFEDT